MGNSPLIAARISPDLHEAVDAFAVRHGVTRSEVLVAALVQYLTEAHPPPAPAAFPTGDILVCPRPDLTHPLPREPHMNLLRLEILQNGRVLRTHDHEGQAFLEAPPSGNYEIRLTNLTGERVLAVPSVDGVNVLSGEDASYQGGGYVLGPYQTTTINGWHRTASETAAFVFAAAQGGSYASQTGRGTRNVGVIGVAAFREHQPTSQNHSYVRRSSRRVGSMQWSDDSATKGIRGRDLLEEMGMLGGEEDRCAGSLFPEGQAKASYSTEPTASALPAADTIGSPLRSRGAGGMSVQPQDLGTGYGERKEMRTTTTTFTRRTEIPEQILQLRYASREVLASWGVPVDRPMPPEAPSAFPQSVGVPAPPGWRG